MTREEQVALIAWLRRPGVVWSAVTERLEECGSVQAAVAGEAPAQGSLFETAQADGLDEANRDLERWERADIRLVCVLDSEYPSNLRIIHQHPPVLFTRGTADERDGTANVASALTEWIAVGDWTLYARYADELAKVTPADVQRVAKAYLDKDHSTTGWFSRAIRAA